MALWNAYWLHIADDGELAEALLQAVDALPGVHPAFRVDRFGAGNSVSPLSDASAQAVVELLEQRGAVSFRGGGRADHPVMEIVFNSVHLMTKMHARHGGPDLQVARGAAAWGGCVWSLIPPAAPEVAVVAAFDQLCDVIPRVQLAKLSPRGLYACHRQVVGVLGGGRGRSPSSAEEYRRQMELPDGTARLPTFGWRTWVEQSYAQALGLDQTILRTLDGVRVENDEGGVRFVLGASSFDPANEGDVARYRAALDALRPVLVDPRL